MSPILKKPRPGFQNRNTISTAIQILLLILGLSVVIIVSTGMGYIKIPLDAVVKIILAKISGQLSWIEGMDNLFPVVVIDVRLPRILSAAIVGGGLAISGVVFQGILLNPLADPYTLGVSAGAAFGCVPGIAVKHRDCWEVTRCLCSHLSGRSVPCSLSFTFRHRAAVYHQTT